MTISEKVAHLKGIMEGLSYPSDTPEGKIFYAITDILSDLALEVDDLEANADQLRDYVEELDEDLGEVEEYLFVTDEDEDEDEDENEDEYDAHEYDVDPLEFDDDDEDEDDEDIYALECPNCGETIYLDGSLLDEPDILCPACHESISFTLEEEDDEESADGEKSVYNDQCTD